MTWYKGRCPDLSPKGCCRVAAHIAKLPVGHFPVTESQCATCKTLSMPSYEEPNEVVSAVVLEGIHKHSPERTKHVQARLPLPTDVQPVARQYTEADFPCPHRRPQDIPRDFQCTPCDGGVNHPVHWCSELWRECTTFAAPRALDSDDGKPVECCIACPHLPEPKEPELGPRRIDYLTTPAGEKVGQHWANRYTDQRVFLVCGGPSLRNTNLKLLDQRGINVASINNAATQVRSQFWFSADPPHRFHESIWKDGTIAKFVKNDRVGQPTRRTDMTIGGPAPYSFPNVWVCHRETHETMTPERFLKAPRPIWASETGQRSTMLLALRMLIDFGFRTIYLVGCDFHMTATDPYAWGENGSEGKAASNNRTFAWLNETFAKLRPILERRGVFITNCTPGGNLSAFDRMDLADAVDLTLDAMPAIGDLRGYYAA